jgi:hypothetical protein
MLVLTRLAMQSRGWIGAHGTLCGVPSRSDLEPVSVVSVQGLQLRLEHRLERRYQHRANLPNPEIGKTSSSVLEVSLFMAPTRSSERRNECRKDHLLVRRRSTWFW